MLVDTALHMVLILVKGNLAGSPFPLEVDVFRHGSEIAVTWYLIPEI